MPLCPCGAEPRPSATNSTLPLFGSRMPRWPEPCAENQTGPPGVASAHTSWMPWPRGMGYSWMLTWARAAGAAHSARMKSLMAMPLMYSRAKAYMTDKTAFTLDLRLQVGQYDIQKLLGQGATGTVYLARDTFTGKEVALKTIEPEVFRDPEFGTVYRSQFLNEASLAGKL